MKNHAINYLNGGAKHMPINLHSVWRFPENICAVHRMEIKMKKFMDDNFLLSTKTAQRLYHEYAADVPIIDYHCHVSPKEIFEDRKFKNITEVWLSADHYKWRIMRADGVSEKYITGSATDREKFQKFAQALPKAIGNPMYHWCHLELKTYFGYEGALSGETAQEVWDLAQEKLKQSNMSVRGLISQSNVAFVGTTDDPLDNLQWHKKLAKDSTFKTVVAPSFRPDKALNIEKEGWLNYINELSGVCGFEIKDLDMLKKALKERINYFDKTGCKSSDHGLDYIVCRKASEEETNAIMQKALSGTVVSREESEIFKTALLVFCGRLYSKLGWVQQWHYNCMRNTNTKMFEKLGADTGFDTINTVNCSRALAALLNELEIAGELPKTIIYSLNPADNELIGTIIGAFQGEGIHGKIQHGSGWWFNDTKTGMIEQMTSLANLGLLGNFIGMLTDSRSFLSYTRHAYFRRILCELIGNWVENGEYPADFEALGLLVQDICGYNAMRYFSLKAE